MLVLGGGVVCAGAVAAMPLRNPVAANLRQMLVAQSWARRFLSLASAGYGEWLEQVGSVFTVAGGYRIKLAGVRPLPSEGERPLHVGRDQAFLAVFEVMDGGTMAGDLIYTANHPQYGSLPIFLSESATPNRMHAVFN